MPTATNGLVPIDYTDEGIDGPTLLLLPDWCTDKRVFGAVRWPLSRQRRVVTLDWRGHGRSGKPSADFGEGGLVEDALAVIRAARLNRVVPVAMAHAGWVAIRLRETLRDGVPAIVLVDWILTEALPPFRHTLDALRSPEVWQRTVNRLTEAWRGGVDDPRLGEVVAGARATDFEMWARAAREVDAAYRRRRSPLAALEQLDPPAPTLHLCALRADPAEEALQEDYARAHPWFSIRRLEARSHFPSLELPEEVAQAILEFVERQAVAKLRAA
jgi:pimeloyl-ACP methyl ester carboxylesterase